MHRLQAALLLLAFSFSLIVPAVYSGAESQLPACCRSHGKHACSMKGAPENSSGPSLRAPGKCPSYPVGRALAAHEKIPVVKQTSVIGAWLAAQPAALVQTEALYRVSYSRSSQKRGPPHTT
ncbi:MAG TPA: hypothetical protein VM120_10980 [Bryobacteraceae bacterium]|nr:hypothetical protein [Bryobacteraceae bacterium]